MSKIDIAHPLFPDLLSLDEIKNVLAKNYPGIRNIQRLLKEEAAEMYNRMLVPRPQREYPLNSRGERLNNRRRRQKELTTDSAVSSILSQEKVWLKKQSTNDRLKPPPETSIASTKRKICTKAGDTSTLKIVRETRESSSEMDDISVSMKRHKPPASPINSNSSATQSEASRPKRTKITWP